MANPLSTKPFPKYLYKIVPFTTPIPTSELPHALPLSALDAADNFIHLSTAAQTPLTAARFFAAERKLWVLKIEVQNTTARGEMRWEAVRGHEDPFAHLYGGRLGSGVVVDSVEYFKGEGESWVDAIKTIDEGWLVDG